MKERKFSILVYLIGLLFSFGYYSCDNYCDDCLVNICDNNFCLWLTNSSEKVWQAEYVTTYPASKDTCFRDNLSDTQKNERFTFYVDGTLKIENTFSGWGPCQLIYSFDSVGNELIMKSEIITSSEDCENIPNNLRIIQLTKDLFAYKWENRNYVTYFKPL